MNIYRIRFAAKCKNNGHTIDYDLQIESEHFVMAEDIEATADQCSAAGIYHEEIADFCFLRHGGVQTITARHGRVDVTTIRG